jgi:hypothetical protein
VSEPPTLPPPERINLSALEPPETSSYARAQPSCKLDLLSHLNFDAALSKAGNCARIVSKSMQRTRFHGPAQWDTLNYHNTDS